MKAFVTDIAGHVYVADVSNCQITEGAVQISNPSMYVRNSNGNHSCDGSLNGSITLDQYQIEDVSYVGYI